MSHAVSCGHRVDAIKVLLIDDDERCCLRPMTRAFRTLGCEVETATDGQIGLELAAHFRPDCTIVDHVMPGLSGSELVQQVKLAVPGTFIILYSGALSLMSAFVAGRGGADALVEKPVSARYLLDLFRTSSRSAPGPNLDQLSRDAVFQMLARTRGNKSEAARQLGITRRGLQKKLKKWGGY